MAAPAKVKPRLESGDRMTRFEFHRRYEAHPEIKKAELIEGVVYVASPLSYRHGKPHSLVMLWLGTYWRRHTDLEVLDNTTVVLDVDNEVQPDAFLRLTHGGSTILDDRGFFVGPPELVVEVAASSVSIDLHDKMDAYRRNGVREYIAWRVDDEAIDWFRLEDGEYRRVEPGPDGIIESSQFPGLRLNAPAMLAGDPEAVAAAVG